MGFSAFGLLTSDPNLVGCELSRLGGAVSLGVSGSGEHAGLGSYTQDEVLLRLFAWDSVPREPAGLAPIHESPVVLFLDQVPSRPGAPATEQPLRFGSWLFVVGGDLPPDIRWRRSVDQELPPYLQSQLASWGPAQTVFAYFLKQLRETGRTADPRLPAALAGAAMAETSRRLRESSSDVVLMATNGHLLAASRVGAPPLFFTLLEGSGECPLHPLENGALRQHRRCRSVAVASHPVRSAGWRELSAGQSLCADEKLELSFRS